MSLLFRQEALEARRDTWLGRVQISQPLPVRIVAWSCAVLALGAMLLLIFGTYTRRVHATGQVMPKSGLLTLGATQPGTISMIHAREGQRVQKGDLLFTEDLEATSLTGPTQKQILGDLLRQKTLLQKQRSLREKSAPIEHQALLNQVQFLTRQRELISTQLSSDENVLPLVQRALAKMQGAEQSHLIGEAQFQSQLYTYAQLFSAHSQALQSRTDTESKIADLASKLARFDSEYTHDLNDLDRQIAAIDQQTAENEGRRSTIVFAPEDGILTGVRSYLGEQVTAGTPLVTLLPTDGSLQIELYINSASIGFLKENEPVLLRYDAFPYQKFGLHHGHIAEITHAPLASNNAQDNRNAEIIGAQNNSPTQDIYRIRVEPDHSYVVTYGRQRPLEAGMTVSADIATDRRRLWEWLLDPVISVHTTLKTTTIGPR
ncbi:HlyD family secretion protein [Gluconobacter thailandicus]|uniref:HlyD family efflux transporter periplasmic adaptor subunit n=1 Tax=Gluconobacter thailandicus TaxID=257438 RepID=A0AAP9EVJ1_GLUTH|nr:HlyD family efflux transporter periplasmic adaptor subunit [Gluconobacter thailandicus]QEH97874.1 HlyD family efflux transporter periplasmic adaptor subunit [Gluconobacter thailandicus]